LGKGGRLRSQSSGGRRRFLRGGKRGGLPVQKGRSRLHRVFTDRWKVAHPSPEKESWRKIHQNESGGRTGGKRPSSWDFIGEDFLRLKDGDLEWGGRKKCTSANSVRYKLKERKEKKKVPSPTSPGASSLRTHGSPPEGEEKLETYPHSEKTEKDTKGESTGLVAAYKLPLA